MNEKPSILEVVERYVPLHRAGRELVGLCPFHGDKNPSFSVNVEKNLWYCHSCAEGGDAIRFVEKLHRISFKETVKLLGLDSAHSRPRPVDSGIRGEAKRMATWANALSKILSEKLREIGQRKFLCRQLGLIAEGERLGRMWSILCDLDDDINNPKALVEIWSQRPDIETLVETC